MFPLSPLNLFIPLSLIPGLTTTSSYLASKWLGAKQEWLLLSVWYGRGACMARRDGYNDTGLVWDGSCMEMAGKDRDKALGGVLELC